MANHVNSAIEIHEGNDAVRKWFADLSQSMRLSDEERGDSWEYWHPVHKMFDTWDESEYDEETYGWYSDNIGAKWCHIQDGDEERMMFESAWGYPDALFLRIHQEAYKIDPEVILTGWYEDEMPNFFGSLVYAENELYDEEYVGEDAYEHYDIKFWWDEDEDGEEPEDFEPDYEKMWDIIHEDTQSMIQGLKEHREELAEENDSE